MGEANRARHRIETGRLVMALLFVMCAALFALTSGEALRFL